MKSYAIADLEGPPDEQFFARVAALAEAGVEMIQLRGKSFEARALLEVAGHMRAITAGKSSFLVNGRTDVAIAAGADGALKATTYGRIAAWVSACGRPKLPPRT
jgi:thiamine monophosphate synthase